MTNFAIILAGGMGNRIGGDVPKQLLPLGDGRSILEHSVEAFERADCISAIGIVMHADYITTAHELIRKNSWTKVKFVIAGGRERWESSVNAIREIEKIVDTEVQKDSTNVLLHDAARPFVSQRIIADVCAALEKHKAATVATPATDTIYMVDADVVRSIPPRAQLMCAQTPQGFRLGTIAQAYRLALNDAAMQATDDCGILHRYLPNVPIAIVLGEAGNRKITYPEDLNSRAYKIVKSETDDAIK